ncbi:glycosyltransferase family 2 protein [Patescibacteria group bacterium]|nr:glycosyltransferase family 2 protein [Patescibacteria group bacterium]MBU2036447.1 glycosyltransferase family 2 protein [Patescibacteria group bacterium]
MNISSIIITKNEEKNIRRCLESVSFSDEIIIVDDYSNDKTLEIAQNYKAKIFQRKLNQNFADQRNFGLSKARAKWVFFIDADEEVPVDLRNEIIQITSDPLNTKNGFFVKRKDYLFFKKLNHGEWGNKRILKLIKNESGKWVRDVHEVLKVDGKVDTLKSELNHYPHKSLNDFIKSVNLFSSIHAVSNKKEGKKANMFKVIFYPFFKFIYNWIIREGFKDKDYGFIMSLMMSFHSFLAWSKLWQETKK